MITQMLQKDPFKRASLEDLLDHPWYKKFLNKKFEDDTDLKFDIA
jgi:serine/threonine protein kinase